MQSRVGGISLDPEVTETHINTSHETQLTQGEDHPDVSLSPGPTSRKWDSGKLPCS